MFPCCLGLLLLRTVSLAALAFPCFWGLPFLLRRSFGCIYTRSYLLNGCGFHLQEQEQEQEQEKEEIVMDDDPEEFVRMKYARDDEAIRPWAIRDLSRPLVSNLGFYPASDFGVLTKLIQQVCFQFSVFLFGCFSGGGVRLFFRVLSPARYVFCFVVVAVSSFVT